MLKVEYIRTRLNTNIDFFFPTMTYEDHVPSVFIPHWWSEYRDLGKLVYLVQTLDDTLLIQTSVMKWIDRNTYDAAMSDPIVEKYFAASLSYSAANGITVQGPVLTEE